MWSPNPPSLPLWLLLINSYPYPCLPHNPAPDVPLETSSLFHLLVRSVSITETAIPAVGANLWRDRNHSWWCCLRVGAEPHYAASPLLGGAKADYFSRHILISSMISGLTVSSGPAFWMLDRLVTKSCWCMLWSCFWCRNQGQGPWGAKKFFRSRSSTCEAPSWEPCLEIFFSSITIIINE